MSWARPDSPRARSTRPRLSEGHTTTDVLRQTGLTRREINYRVEQDIIQPSIRRSRKQGCSHQWATIDIVALRAALLLELDPAIPAPGWLPDFIRTIQEHTLASLAGKYLVLDQTQHTHVLDEHGVRVELAAAAAMTGGVVRVIPLDQCLTDLDDAA